MFYSGSELSLAEDICQRGSTCIFKNHQLTNLTKCEKFHACTRNSTSLALSRLASTRNFFYVRSKVDLMKTAKVNAYIMHIFGKIELLSIHAT